MKIFYPNLYSIKEEPFMNMYYTSGQAALKLGVGVSTLKRLANLDEQSKNSKGWYLFSEEDLERLLELKTKKRRAGRVFSAKVLSPVSLLINTEPAAQFECAAGF